MFLFFLTFIHCIFGFSSWSVSVLKKTDLPIISWLNGDTPWMQAFNPSWVESTDGTSGKAGLLVRSQNCTFKAGVCVRCNPGGRFPLNGTQDARSVITFAEQIKNTDKFKTPVLVFSPNASAPKSETRGTEDPRIQFNKADGLYYMFYTCFEADPHPPFLCLATTADPTSSKGWTRHGAVFPKKPNSKSGALHLRPKPPHVLYWGAGKIAYATSQNLLNYSTIQPDFIVPRSDKFDSRLVEAGPPPLALSNGDYLFLYNSADHSLTYRVGWTIINGSDPSQILARSDTPLLIPTRDWELGIKSAECNVPNVVFLEAARKTETPNEFVVYFGGSDAVVGTARIRVNIPA